MKRLKIFFFTYCLINCWFVSYSQKLTTGIYSGVNYSDIHGQEQGGKWKSKPGPVQGLYLGYNFNKTIGIQSGISFSTVYYEHKTTTYPQVYYPTGFYPARDLIIAPYYTLNNSTDFRFIRVPLLVTFSVPTALRFDMKAGIYYSHLQDYEMENYYYSSMAPTEPVRNDFGYIVSSGLSYPFNENFTATFDIGYTAGRKKINENYPYRHGSSEFTMGIAYSGFLKSKTGRTDINDSSSYQVLVSFFGGLDYSWNKDQKEKNYYGYAGPVVGFDLTFPIGRGTSFQTGVKFERKGYSLKDSSSSFYRLTDVNKQEYYVDTKVQIDYAVIPALLKIPVGKSDRIYLNTGPWLGFKLNARSVGVALSEYYSETTYRSNETTVYDDLESAIKNYDIGWLFGGGVSIRIVKNCDMNMALQYSTGFRDVFEYPGTAYNPNPYDDKFGIRHGTLSFLIGFNIPYADR